ncbi:hypothetical protein [Planktothrix paucivesiculata]|uniref:C-type lysozyme inhibitor domain-containing protein n=1 Tax=Planktothrix paucivesiculata PCC 9631 TaxID=671071 RepID=A0A7Z9BLF4_9CYAN|nr:hypothetical protein [Planktothrix paucivesiculata]VXD13127.1 exported hypothetical protein [Planktothrix paucivesiculata PCC 9631]
MAIIKSRLLLSLSLLTTLISLSLPVKADSTADLMVLYNCGEFKIEVWQKKNSGQLIYRSTSSAGNINLTGGKQENTEGVRVYKFRSGDNEYWVWQGTLDNPDTGTLEVYKNGRQVMQRTCSPA